MYIPSIPRISPKIVDDTIGQLNMAMDTATSIDDLLIITSISLGDFHIFSLNLAFINGFSQLDSCTWIFMDFHGFSWISTPFPSFFREFPINFPTKKSRAGQGAPSPLPRRTADVPMRRRRNETKSHLRTTSWDFPAGGSHRGKSLGYPIAGWVSWKIPWGSTQKRLIYGYSMADI